MVYRPSLLNNHFCYCDSEGLGMGSDPTFGLFINKDIKTGSSSKCRTYQNTPLSLEKGDEINKGGFKIKELIVIGLIS